LPSAALVAVTEHVPGDEADKVEPFSEQPALPAVATKLTAPEPEPPLVVRLNGVPTMPDVDVTVNAACTPRPKVTVVGADCTDTKLPSPALVAVTEHDPADVDVNVDPFTTHPDAVPFDAVKLNAPSPDPPDVVSASGTPNVPLVDVSVSAAWLARTTCSVNDCVASGPLPLAAVNVNG
jgi:hypothetical protein